MSSRYDNVEHWSSYFSMYMGIFLLPPSPLVMHYLYNWFIYLGGRWRSTMYWYWRGGELDVILVFLAFIAMVGLLLGIIGQLQSRGRSSIATAGILLCLLAIGQAYYYGVFISPENRSW